VSNSEQLELFHIEAALPERNIDRNQVLYNLHFWEFRDGLRN
jgi:hypothetical protein